jgi:hypothetical protein
MPFTHLRFISTIDVLKKKRKDIEDACSVIRRHAMDAGTPREEMSGMYCDEAVVLPEKRYPKKTA